MGAKSVIIFKADRSINKSTEEEIFVTSWTSTRLSFKKTTKNIEKNTETNIWNSKRILKGKLILEIIFI